MVKLFVYFKIYTKNQRKNIYLQNQYSKERTFYTLWDLQNQYSKEQTFYTLWDFFLLFVPLFWDLIFTQCPMDGQSSLENEYCIYLS